MTTLKTNNQKIFFHYCFSEKRSCLHNFRNHVLVYVYSGELKISKKNNSIILQKGECAFIGKNTQVYMTEILGDDRYSHLLFMVLPREFICEFYHTLGNKRISDGCEKITLSKLPKTPQVTSLFESFKPYYQNSVDLSDEITRIKITEGLYALLKIGDHYHFTLFDFIHNLNIIEILCESQLNDLDWKIRQSTIFLNLGKT